MLPVVVRGERIYSSCRNIISFLPYDCFVINLIAYLILVRHGASEWNLKNIFTGWIDIGLAREGVAEAHQAAKKLKTLQFDLAYTSKLIRAIDTLKIMLKDLNRNVPIIEDQALNERNYGDLQGKNKNATRKQFGEKQVQLWRRSFDVAPPHGESLKDTCARTAPYFQKEILPKLSDGKNVLIVAHGNSLRSIVMVLEKLSPEQIVRVEIPTGVPYIYEFNKNLKIIKKTIL